jgi:hypothetical protein
MNYNLQLRLLNAALIEFFNSEFKKYTWQVLGSTVADNKCLISLKNDAVGEFAFLIIYDLEKKHFVLDFWNGCGLWTADKLDIYDIIHSFENLNSDYDEDDNFIGYSWG